MKSPPFSLKATWLQFSLLFVSICATETTQASSIRYNIDHLQAVYGADLNSFRDLSPGGILSASSKTAWVRIQNNQRYEYPNTVSAGYKPFDDRGVSYYIPNDYPSPPSLYTLDADGTRHNTGYVPQGTTLSLYGHNRTGTIVGGESGLSTGTYPSGGFIYDPVNGGRVIQSLGGVDVIEFQALNDAGYLVGYGLTQDTLRGNLFLWRDGEPAISLIQSNGSQASAINKAAQVVGVANGRAFFWQNGTMTLPVRRLVEDPAHPGVFNESVIYSAANDISEDGLMVGTTDLRSVPGYNPSFSSLHKGWIWSEADGLLWLDDLIDPALDFHLWGASAISDTGQILARGTIGNSNVLQDFLLTPIPEPEVAGLLMLGLALGFRRQRS